MYNFLFQFYTVIRNVKKAHQIQESGEFQEFNDDVEYILDALQDNNPIGTRYVLWFVKTSDVILILEFNNTQVLLNSRIDNYLLD